MVVDKEAVLSCLVLCFNWQDPIQGSTPMPQWPNRLIFLMVFIFIFSSSFYGFFSLQGSTPIDAVSIARDR